MNKNCGYTILKAVMLENGRGFALGHNPQAVAPFVTWACYDDKVSGKREYEWGHYVADRDRAEADFLERVRDYQEQFHVEVKSVEAPGLYKYYSTQRPVDIGTFPKPPHNAPDEIKNFDKRIPVEGGTFLAWGYLTYTRPLSERDMYNYELRPAPENPGQRRDRPRPIAEQLAEAERLAQEHRGQTADRPAPEWGDR